MKLIIYWARNGCLYNSITQKGVCHEIIDKNPVYNRSFSGSTFLNQLPNTVQLLQKSQNLVSKQVHKLLVVWRRFAMVRTSTNWYRMEIRLNAFSSVNFQKKWWIILTVIIIQYLYESFHYQDSITQQGSFAQLKYI